MDLFRSGAILKKSWVWFWQFQRCVHRGQFCCRMNEFSQVRREGFSTALSSFLGSESAMMSSAKMSSFLGSVMILSWSKRHEIRQVCSVKKVRKWSISQKRAGYFRFLISNALHTFIYGAIFLSNCPKILQEMEMILSRVGDEDATQSNQGAPCGKLSSDFGSVSSRLKNAGYENVEESAR